MRYPYLEKSIQILRLRLELNNIPKLTKYKCANVHKYPSLAQMKKNKKQNEKSTNN